MVGEEEEVKWRRLTTTTSWWRVRRAGVSHNWSCTTFNRIECSHDNRFRHSPTDGSQQRQHPIRQIKWCNRVSIAAQRRTPVWIVRRRLWRTLHGTPCINSTSLWCRHLRISSRWWTTTKRSNRRFLSLTSHKIQPAVRVRVPVQYMERNRRAKKWSRIKGTGGGIKDIYGERRVYWCFDDRGCAISGLPL